MNLSDEEWKAKLTPEQYHLLREKGTEAPYNGDYILPDKDGNFYCVACGNLLFSSDTQYESTLPGLKGWPSFGDVASGDAVELHQDDTFGMSRNEVTCKKCGGHLGHLFDDPTSGTNQHYCINGGALNFKDK